MSIQTKSSITLPLNEKKLVERLRKRLSLKSNVEVVRKGLRLLETSLDRQELRKAYIAASAQAQELSLDEMRELDALSAEGLQNET